MSGIVKFFGRVRVDMLDRHDPDQRHSRVQVYRTVEHFTVETAKYGAITVPAGFLTDFASVPSAARAYVSNEHPAIGKAALVHDYGYTRHLLTRAEMDDLFRIVMLAEGMRPSQAWVVHAMVRIFGASHWKSKPRSKP